MRQLGILTKASLKHAQNFEKLNDVSVSAALLTFHACGSLEQRLRHLAHCKASALACLLDNLRHISQKRTRDDLLCILDSVCLGTSAGPRAACCKDFWQAANASLTSPLPEDHGQTVREASEALQLPGGHKSHRMPDAQPSPGPPVLRRCKYPTCHTPRGRSHVCLHVSNAQRATRLMYAVLQHLAQCLVGLTLLS